MREGGTYKVECPQCKTENVATQVFGKVELHCTGCTAKLNVTLSPEMDPEEGPLVNVVTPRMKVTLVLRDSRDEIPGDITVTMFVLTEDELAGVGAVARVSAHHVGERWTVVKASAEVAR